MNKYIVLWIPQVSNSRPTPVCTRLKEITLRDVPSTNGITIKAESTTNKDITLYYKEESTVDFVPIHLDFINSDLCGYIQYKYEIPDEPTDNFVTELLRDDFHKAFYHYLKLFFHNHKNHGTDEDSLLKPFVCNREIDLQQPTDREAVAENYLDCYITKFNGCYRDTLATIENTVEQIVQNKDVTKNIKFLGKYVRHNRAIVNEISYAKYLLEVHKNDNIQEVKNRLESSLKSFCDVDSNLRFWYNHYMDVSSFKSSILSVQLGWLGAIVGGISLMATFCLEVYHSLDHSTDSSLQRIEKSVQEINIQMQQNEKLDLKLDSILDEIETLKIGSPKK